MGFHPQKVCYDALITRWRSLRERGDVIVREIACGGAAGTLTLAEYGDPAGPLVQLSAGTHGDEPAAPWALLGAVRDGLLDPRLRYRIWACLNPSGYRAGTRTNAEGDDVNRSFSRGGQTPEARAVITANRDRRFVLAVDLHEDVDAAGFYCYEQCPDGNTTRFTGGVLAAVEAAGFPLQDLAGHDLGVPEAAKEAFTFRRGGVAVDAKREMAGFSGGFPLSLFLMRQATAAAMTFETPAGRLWDDRIAMHRTALVAALAQLAL